MLQKRKRNRLFGVDYSKDNTFFVTSNVRWMKHYFGVIENREMILNELGIMVWDEWKDLSLRYPYIIQHAFILMPNHFHCIIEINRNHFKNQIQDSELRYGIKIKSLSELIGAFKMVTAKKIRLQGHLEFKWHRSFYERIIRNENEFRRIKYYIEKNPENWKKK